MKNLEYDMGFPTTIDLWREKREIKKVKEDYFGEDFGWEAKDETTF